MYEQLFEMHSKMMKALSHPRRLEIINLLRDQELCVSEIYEMLNLPQANISQHLMILRDEGILTTKRDGKQVIYTLANPKIIAASDLLREVLVEQNQTTAVAGLIELKMKDLVPLVHDPVCQMRVSPKTAGGNIKHNDQEYYFCASGCLKKFTENPEKYVKN